MNVRRPVVTALLALAALFSGSLQADGCPPAGWDIGRLSELKAHEFAIADDEQRQHLAIALLACLGSTSGELRDGIAFEAYSNWLRAGKLDVATRLAAIDELLPLLAPDAGDAQGFHQPFATLVLSELARADRKSPYLSPEQRAGLLEAGARYLETLRDYRGFDPGNGWRHGVAHSADLMLQLALNDKLDKQQLDRILAAVRSQVAPEGEHFYIYGEPERLARPVLYAALRGLHGAEEWNAWFAQLSAPAPLPGWDAAYRSNAGLAKRHNTRAFLLFVFAEIRDSKDARLRQMLPTVTAALAAVP